LLIFTSMRHTSRITLILLFLSSLLSAQSSNDVQILVEAMLGETPLEENLQELCDEIGGRVTGSDANKASVEWGYQQFADAGVKVWKQAFEMPVLWLPEACKGRVEGDLDFDPLMVAKYQTAPGAYRGTLVDLAFGTEEDFVKNAVQLKDNFALIETDICFDINGLFAEYTQAAKVEMLAEQYGAKGIVFMSTRPNGLLYRFITSKGVELPMPQFVMAREDAKRCLRSLRKGKTLNFTGKLRAEVGEAFTSHNVIAEIPGSEFPDEVLVIGAHLDSWALGTGANDNGCNVSMMIDIARQMKKAGIQPKRTIRFALWNGEEQGYFGSLAYTKEYAKTLDKHKMALSVDIGSGPIIGFFTNGRDELIPILDELLTPVDSLSSYLNINNPIVGTDNFDFMLQGVPNLVANHKPALYGPNYHAASDTYDKVDLVSLKKNTAIIAAMVLGFANGDFDLKRHNRAEVQNMIDTHKIEFSMRMFNVWDSWVNKTRGIK